MKNFGFRMLVALLPFTLFGCSGLAPQVSYQSRNLGDVPLDIAYQQGVQTIQEQFQIDRADPDSHEIVSSPQSFTTERDTGKISSAVMPTRTSMRRVAMMRFRREGLQTFADIRVEVQRLDRAAAVSLSRLDAAEDAADDMRVDTPVEESGPVSASDGGVWTNVRTDRRTEKTILDRLEERVQGVAPQDVPEEEPLP
jgi:hypothetical protein